MGLLRNGIYGYKVAGNATLLGSRLPFTKNFATNVLAWQNKGGNVLSREQVSFPNGLSQSAFYMPLKGGGMAVTIRGGSNLTAGINATADLAATLTGGGNISTANGTLGYNIYCTLTGGGELTLTAINAVANLRCTIQIGANPSAYDISQAVWGAISTLNNQADTMGEKLNSAGGAADPWANPDALTVPKFIALK